MDRDHALADQTVLVRGDRIVAVGAAAAIAVSADATIVDGAGHYLLPGLVDAHVHLLGFGPGPRDNFADGPIYLANGITTVVNLGGPDTPRRATELEWKHRVDAGEMIGPTIYTAGAFVNEPRVTTPDEVERDVRAQAQNGYDLIKMHELDDTTTGLSLASYRRLIETARGLGIPLVGHAPNNLGVDAMLEARQPLAHLGNLSNIYFLPLASHRGTLLVTATAFFLLIAAATLSGAPPLSRAMALFAFVAFVCLALFLPGGPLFESLALRILVTILTGLVAAGALLLALVTMKLWGDPRSSTSTNVRATVALTASAALAIVLSTFWTPIAWRSSTRGIDALAVRLHDAGIPMQSTLIVYEAIGGLNRFYRLPAFNMKVARALHRAGVTLVAGTDARGIPQMPPGTSLHRELQLLHESGLSAYEVIRAATVAPAAFLRKEQEFGTVTAGQRADLLLVERNPLDDLTALKTPLGVMARGRWYPHGQAKQE
jgi:predicted amidohydrolase